MIKKNVNQLQRIKKKIDQYLWERKHTFGFNVAGIPVMTDRNFKKGIVGSMPASCGKRTYYEAVQEAFPSMSKTSINRLFKDKAVKVYKYNCEPDEDPDELFGGLFTFSVMCVGKKRAFLFRD